jgi:hypothetical protein
MCVKKKKDRIEKNARRALGGNIFKKNISWRGWWFYRENKWRFVVLAM